MKGINDLLGRVSDLTLNCFGHTAHSLFDFSNIHGGISLMETIRQYPLELLSILGETNISDPAGKPLTRHIVNGQSSAGSDGSVNNVTGGHAFCISDN